MTGDDGTSTTSRDAHRPAWFNWLFADRKTGRIVIVQFPNLSLWLFIGVLLIGALAPDSAPAGLTKALDIASVVILFWWSLDELVRGVNPWRRILGAAVALFVIAFPVRELVGLG